MCELHRAGLNDFRILIEYLRTTSSGGMYAHETRRNTGSPDDDSGMDQLSAREGQVSSFGVTERLAVPRTSGKANGF